MGDLSSKLNGVMFCALGVAAAVYVGTAERTPTEPPNDAWFQQTVIHQQGPVLVKFGAPWCGPCQMLEGELDVLERRAQGRLTVVRISTDEQPALAQHYGVRGIPHVFLFEQGQVVADRVGYADQAQLADWVQGSLKQQHQQHAAAAR